MTSCPACGVAVVPGYVKCPRCGTRLPSINFRKGAETANAGGTAVVDVGARFPWWAPVAGVGAVVVIAVVIIAVKSRGPSSKSDEPLPVPVSVVAPPRPVAAVPTAPDAVPTPVPVAPTGPSATQLAEDLRHALDRQRLWATVRVEGTSLEIRSGSCSDAQMKPALDAVAPTARAAGLKRMRCLEESGAVAILKDL